jgi:GGDEF-like domain/PucR C-terminal helix-turn-helix domain
VCNPWYVQLMGTPDPVDEALASFFARVKPRAAEYAAGSVARIRESVPEGAVPDDDWFWDAVQRSYGANVAYLLDLRERGVEPTELPRESVEFARAVARAGLPPDVIATVFRAGQERLFDGLRAELDPLDLDPATKLALLDRVMAFGSRHAAWTGQKVAEQYARELESRAGTLLALVRQVLDGRAAEEVQLGYALHSRHLGLVVCGTAARDVAGKLAAELGRRPLAVAPDEETAWVWLSEQPEPDARQRRRLSELAAADGVVVGVGSARSGIAGFRRSHEQAAIAARCAEPLALYTEVLPEALALGDPHAAEELVAHTLGPLGDDARGRRLRETLRAYATAGNGASAASLLGVSRRTFAYRMADIEKRLGGPVASRRTEIDLALRLERHVAG